MATTLIVWDRSVFDGEKRLLPNSRRLSTQLYDTPEEGKNWTLVFDFEESPRIQGYKSKATVHFLVDDAPEYVLKPGYRFDFLDGGKKVGICEIIASKSINISKLFEKIGSIEKEKIAFADYVNKIEIQEISYSDKHLRDLAKHCVDYPFLFSFIVRLNKAIALEYLKEYFFKPPLKDNFVYNSHLPLFLFNLKTEIGEEELLEFVGDLPECIRNDALVTGALELAI